MKKKQEAAKKQNKVAKNKAAEKSGLSFQEKKQLRDLKKALAGTDKDTKTPDTAQKTITFEKMYKDGICKVSDKHYTKMVEFYDINYDLLEIEDQGTILEEYSKLINYFDPSIKFQLFLFNRQVSAKELAAQLNIALQGDAFDDIREEYRDVFAHAIWLFH